MWHVGEEHARRGVPGLQDVPCLCGCCTGRFAPVLLQASADRVVGALPGLLPSAATRRAMSSKQSTRTSAVTSGAVSGAAEAARRISHRRTPLSITSLSRAARPEGMACAGRWAMSSTNKVASRRAPQLGLGSAGMRDAGPALCRPFGCFRLAAELLDHDVQELVECVVQMPDHRWSARQREGRGCHPSCVPGAG